MDMLANLVAVHVPGDDVDLYSVRESGWYAVDEENRAVLGPFESLGECDEAIRERVGRERADDARADDARAGSMLHQPSGSTGHMLDRL